jgi:hypothetical protein
MAFTEGSTDGTLNSTTPVTLVAAPAASTRRVVKCINVQNRDTVAVTLTVNYVSAGGTRQIWKGTLSVNDTIVFGEEDLYVLDATTKSITGVLAGAITTSQPDYVSTWADVT